MVIIHKRLSQLSSCILAPTIGEMLLYKVEPTNFFDDFAMSVVQDGTVVRHVLKYISRCLFLSQEG